MHLKYRRYSKNLKKKFNSKPPSFYFYSWQVFFRAEVTRSLEIKIFYLNPPSTILATSTVIVLSTSTGTRQRAWWYPTTTTEVLRRRVTSYQGTALMGSPSWLYGTPTTSLLEIWMKNASPDRNVIILDHATKDNECFFLDVICKFSVMLV